MIKVFNLRTNEVQYFDTEISPEWATAFCHCEESHLMSALLASLQYEMFPEFFKTLPVTRGKSSLACGDWATCVGDPA